MHGPLDLLLNRADYHDQPVETLVAPGLDMNGGLHYYDRIRIGQEVLLHEGVGPLPDFRMHQAVQQPQPLGIGEYFERQALAVDLAIRSENAAAERPHHRFISRAVRHEHFVTERVGLDQLATQVFERRADKALAARQSSGQPYLQHNRRSADSIVFTISMAMV